MKRKLLIAATIISGLYTAALMWGLMVPVLLDDWPSTAPGAFADEIAFTLLCGAVFTACLYAVTRQRRSQ